MLKGLHLYEVVLMFLGIALFVVLLFLLVYSVINSRELKMILLAFLLPVLMIGFPSIKKLQYDKLIVDLERQAVALEQRPADPQLRANAEATLAEITARPLENSPETLVTVARTQNALGNDAQALETINKALQVAPQLPEAQRVKTVIVEQQNLKRDATQLEEKTKRLESNPGDANLKQEVNDGIRNVKSRSTLNTEVLGRLARAQKAIGQEEEAIKTAKEAVKIDPTAASRIAPMIRVDPRTLSTTTARPPAAVTPKP